MLGGVSHDKAYRQTRTGGGRPVRRSGAEYTDCDRGWRKAAPGGTRFPRLGRRAEIHGRLQSDTVERPGELRPVRDGAQDLDAAVRAAATLGFSAAARSRFGAAPRPASATSERWWT